MRGIDLDRLRDELTDKLLFVLLAEKQRQLIERRLWPTDGLVDERSGCAQELQGTKVAVVGAGFAGLTAAWYLARFGVQVVVFEAMNRLGGRVHSDHGFAAPRVTEFGAELIGVNHPLWWLLRQWFGLQLVKISTERDYRKLKLETRLRLGSAFVDREEIEEKLIPTLRQIGEDAEDVDPFEPWTPWGTSPAPTDYDAMSVRARLDQLMGAASSPEREFLEFLIENDNCSPPEPNTPRLGNDSYLGCSPW